MTLYYLLDSGKSQRRKGRSSSPASHAKAKQTDGEEQKPSQGSGGKQENSNKESKEGGAKGSVDILKESRQ